jgi:hypothetical protein
MLYRREFHGTNRFNTIDLSMSGMRRRRPASLERKGWVRHRRQEAGAVRMEDVCA